MADKTIVTSENLTEVLQCLGHEWALTYENLAGNRLGPWTMMEYGYPRWHMSARAKTPVEVVQKVLNVRYNGYAPEPEVDNTNIEA